MTSRLWTPQELAEFLGVSPKTVYRLLWDCQRKRRTLHQDQVGSSLHKFQRPGEGDVARSMITLSVRTANGVVLELSVPSSELKRIFVALGSRGKLPDLAAELLILALNLEEE